MKAPPFEYHEADTVDHAVALLAEYGEEAKLLAGGQSLVPLLALRLVRPEHLIDINRVGDLASIADADGLRLGGLVRQRMAERSTTVKAANPLLAGALHFIGHAAIRNRGTIGGSLAHADPAAELPTVLVALDGEAEVTSQRGTRMIAASQLFTGFLSTTLEPDELLSAAHFPRWPSGAGWSFREFSRRSGDFAIAGVAAVLRLAANGTVAEARIALSGMSDTPVRATKAEAALVGQAPSEDVWAAASADAVAGLQPPSDLHGSAAYRLYLAAALTRRALREAHASAEVAG